MRALKIISTVLLVAALSAAPCYAESVPEYMNASGIVNREISVNPAEKSEGFTAVLYDNTNGLPTSEANAIAETSEGFIWIGSYAGLIRYDGNTFERMDSTGGLTSIKCLYVDSKDRLWIGTNDNGVAVMERGNIRRWTKLDGMKSAHTRAITEDDNGVIYIATAGGIMMIDSNFNLSSMEDPRVAEADMRDIRKGAGGIIYGVTDNGDVMTISDGELLTYITSEDNPVGGAGTIFPDPDREGIIYQEATDFLVHIVDSNNGYAELKTIDIAPLKYVKCMEYIDGKIWICAGNGIGVLDNDEFSTVTNLPMNNNVCHVMTDYLGNLWFASTRQGVMKVVPNQFSNLSDWYGLSEMVVNSTCYLDDKLFVATDAGLIVLDDKNVVSSMPLKSAKTALGEELESKDLIELLSGARIRSIVKDSKDRLWISTWRTNVGLVCYDHGDVLSFNEAEGLINYSIRAVHECEDGSILVALTGGVSVIKGDKVVASYGREDGITTVESLCVTEGPNGDIVLGSNGGGIYVINEDGLRNINVEEGLPSDIVMRLKNDPERELIWIVTSNAIAYMDYDYNVTTVEKFPYPNNFDMFESKSNDMWVLSSNGIYVVPTEELIANGDLNPVFYGTASGLSCIATANSYSDLNDDGTLYIAGSTGICSVNIDQPFEDVNDLNAVVPFVEADGRVIYPNESGVITIPADTQKLTLYGFVYNYCLSDPQVTYQLEGFDSHSTTINRSEMLPLDYTNLRGGKYNFVMQLKDSLGRGNKEVSVKIVKEKAYYEETWFYIVLVGLAIALIYLVVKMYIRRRMKAMEKKQQEAFEQFVQTSEALANAIDAKDSYTNGHSRRVAEYSVEIAKAAGLSEEECERVYFAGLLHDVGKIGVPNEIITKTSRLTDEEFAYIKRHPATGAQILSSIKKSPWLSIGAHYHHERYDGKGYPEGKAGEDIPEIARIIAVADAYDAMTSNRSYRNAIPQHIVREELVKGSGTQFDPDYARLMIHMIDLDSEYKMKESVSGANVSSTTSLRCESIYHDCTDGVGITMNKTTIHICSQPDSGLPEEESLPTLIIFDSLDGKVHPGEENNKNIRYAEYAKIRLDGHVEEDDVRKAEVRFRDSDSDLQRKFEGDPEEGQHYKIEAVRNRDHVYLRISGEKKAFDVILALPDISRYAYISVTGENCEVHNIFVDVDTEETPKDSIPRIAEEISYIKGLPSGDIPNIEVYGPRLATSEVIPMVDGMTLSFHTASFTTAFLVWHCPYICLFSAYDGKIGGMNYREHLLLRLDGESWAEDTHTENDVSVERKDDFDNWDAWKEKNKKGYDCTVSIRRVKDRVVMDTENQGISIHSETVIRNAPRDLYIALTGDQCVITNIRIRR
jgi:energy-coupling factor transport system substrate-specific component